MNSLIAAIEASKSALPARTLVEELLLEAVPHFVGEVAAVIFIALCTWLLHRAGRHLEANRVRRRTRRRARSADAPTIEQKAPRAQRMSWLRRARREG
ncbi:hypothetical protein [Streptomyces sp. NPDC055287]